MTQLTGWGADRERFMTVRRKPGALCGLAASPVAAITARRPVLAATRSRPEVPKVIVRPGQDRPGLDVGVEGADQHAACFEALTIESDTVRERRIAQRGDLVHRDIRQADRSEVLAGQSHGISPLRIYL